jgi:hypothetical protein
MFSNIIQLYIVIGATAFGFFWMIRMAFLEDFNIRNKKWRMFLSSKIFYSVLITGIFIGEYIHYQNREYRPMEITLRSGEKVEDIFRFNIGDIYETPSGRKIHKSEIKLIIVPLSDIDKANP